MTHPRLLITCCMLVHSQVKMMFDLDATDPGIPVLQISAVLTKLGIEMSEDEIASVFDVPGSGDNAFRDAVAAGGECTEFLTFAVRSSPCTVAMALAARHAH